MKIFMIVAVIGLLATTGFGFAGAFDSDVAAEPVSEEPRTCGKVSCDGTGSCGGQCGSAKCSSAVAGSCGCGRR